tara:strand:+ start:2585 stop:3634 length:1050 start_codon:yes stop_codon:yes gene_type:complete
VHDQKQTSSLVANLIAKAHSNHQPLFPTLEITQTCNLACKHCYNFDRTKQALPVNQKEHMSSDQIDSAIEQLRSLGALWINLSGGEPLTHPDILRFVKKAASCHLIPRLKTNGLLFDEDMAKKLKTAGLKGLDISIYGASEKTYEDFTKRSGKEKAFNALKIAKDMGFDVSASIIIHKLNISELSQMIKECQDLGVKFQLSDEITERYDKSPGARDYEIDGNDMRALLSGEHGQLFKYKNHEQGLQCSCAKTVIGIGFDGSVYPCIGAPILAGNVKEQSLADIWKNSPVFSKIRNLKKEDFKSCSTCDFVDYCNRSSGGIYANTGDYCGCDTKTLEFSRIRSIMANNQS